MAQDIREWLDALKPGFAARFSGPFEDIGIEDTFDLGQANASELSDIEEELAAAGCKRLQLRMIMEAIVKLSTRASISSSLELGGSRTPRVSVRQDSVLGTLLQQRQDQNGSASAAVIGRRTSYLQQSSEDCTLASASSESSASIEHPLARGTSVVTVDSKSVASTPVTDDVPSVASGNLAEIAAAPAAVSFVPVDPIVTPTAFSADGYDATPFAQETNNPPVIISYASATDGDRGEQHMWAVGNVLRSEGVSFFTAKYANELDWQ